MTYQIDQSGKTEDTAKNTILCLSNGDWDAVLTPAKTKRQLQEIFRRNGQIRNFIYFTFAAALSLLLERNDKIRQIFIDTEYTGHENTITDIVKNMFNSSIDVISLHWIFIGKKANAHNQAEKQFL